ncbi:hypothetical protein RJT34_30643 [Clitoria ternatea]|uniref:Vacuolar protein sorting-associated protein 13 VPS13 adaptor binding domain-containing protein n=1 Tax=Clitoria ternatea TaxID=43366 RepID=A0AAN9ETV5_CLITE
MPLKSILRRRLLSLLQPWLREEPQLDLQLGFLHSLAVVTNLRFDVSILNQLFDSPAFLFFKDLTIDRLTVRFSTWYTPAFTIETRGVRIMLSIEKPETEGCARRLRTSKFDYSDYLRKKLSVLDPEGCLLHHILERILFAVPERKDFTASFWNLIMKNCHLVAHHIHVEVRLPVLNDEFVCFGEIKEFCASSKYLDKKSLLRGIFSTIFIPTKESTVILKGIGFRVRLIGKNLTDHVLLSSDMQISIKFRDLKLAHCSICFPEIAFSFSPDDISVCLLIHKLLSGKCNQARCARELWRIAASRIGNVIATPRFSLQRLVGVIGHWMHYVNAYENILLLIGYSIGHTWKKSISKMSHKKQILKSVRHHWELISEIEKKLPVEGISLARQIARHRAELKVPFNFPEEFATTHNFFHPFLFILVFMWKKICSIMHCLANIFFRTKIVQDPDNNECCLGSLIEDPYDMCCFVLNFGKIMVTISQINEIHPSIHEKLQSHAAIAYSDFVPVCFSIDALLLVSVEDIFEQKVFLSCGQAKVEPAPLTISEEAYTINTLCSSKGNGKSGINHMESIMWVEPVKIFFLSETDASQAEDSCDSHMDTFMGKLCLSWKGICRKLNEDEIEYSENPCILFKVEISSMFPDHKNSHFGFCECGLLLGQLNLVLTHSSVSSMSLILSHMQHAIYWEKRGEVRVASNFMDKTKNTWVDKYNNYSKGLIMALLQKLPEKHIHFGVFVNGPSVRFSHRRGANHSGQDTDDIISQDNFDLIFDFHEIEVVVGSPCSFGMAALAGQCGLGNAKAECIKLEPRVIEIPKPNNDKYASSGKISIGSYVHVNGVNVCLEKSVENHQIQLFILKPLTVQILSFRDYIYSLSTTMCAFSVASDINAEGFIVLSFLDEVYLIYKAVASLSSVVSYLFSSFDDADFVHPEILKPEALFAEPDSCEATAEEALLTNNVCPFSISINCRFNSMEFVMHNSRTSNNLESFVRMLHSLTGNKIAVQKLPGCGIWISVQQTTTVISCEEGKLDLVTDLSGIMSFVYEYQNSNGNSIDHIVLGKLLLQSVNCLHEISLSGCTFTLCLGLVQNTSSPGNESRTFGSSNTIDNPSYLVQETSLSIFERLSNQSSHCLIKMGSPANSSVLASATPWLLINVAVTNIFIGRCSLKSDLLEAHKVNKLLSSLSVGGEFHTISWEIQGGLVFLETTSLLMAINNYSSYIHYIGNLTSDAHRLNRGMKNEEHDKENYPLDDEIDQGTVRTSQQAASGLPDACDLTLSHFALVLALENDSGGIREIVIEVDIHLNFELATTGRKLTIELSCLSILSQIVHVRVENETEIPHFSSVTSKNVSSQLALANPLSGFQNYGELNSVSDASSSKETVPIIRLSHENQILKNLVAFMSLERPDNGTLQLSKCWFGIGSLSGFDMTLSVSEIQAVLSMTSSLSGISSHNTTKELDRNRWSTDHEVDSSLDATIPDGAIVAIQDVNQHMYFTVEGEEKSFRVGGVIHYSLVGKRALFRVKHCTQRRWKSTVLWFSFISLFAKDDIGVPLRLNSQPGSSFVDISGTDDGECALWRVYPLKGENYVGVTDLEASDQSMKKTFYAANKKNDSAIAFIDGALEFVRKPGHPIKFKVFNDLSAACGFSEMASYPRMAPQTSLRTDAENTSWQGGKLPHINIKIERISLNIVHELSDTEDLFPLICVFINNTQLTIQSLATKSRVISTSSAVVHYFDTQRNLWGELLHPVEICVFYRFNIQAQLSEYTSNAVPVNVFCRMKELDISLNENSLDVLLFVIGTLNLAGPYSVRSSLILANCCKVENQSGLNLLAHFDQQSVTIPRKQSASILLRRISDFKSQDSGAATSVSIQLADFGSLATSSIHLLLSQTQTLAWRTRIMSRDGSRTFPGPMLVVSISRNSEVGLLVVVSPLIRIHNETGFPMELHFQRLEPREDEFASVLLKPGDSIDDSMAMFDALNFSGGVKRALVSLSIGNFLLSFRPQIPQELINSERSLSLEWSDYIKGGKAVLLTGIFNKLSYRVRKALFAKSVKCSVSTAHCTIKSEGVCVASMHFLIQTVARDIPVAPEKSGAAFTNENSRVSLLEQKEIYLLPTVRMTNLLHSDIDVVLSETDQLNLIGCNKIGKQAVISCGSTVDFYANPAVIYFTVTLISSNSSSKPVNSVDCVKKLLKHNNDVQHLDIILEFSGGNFFATLRLYRGNRGVLEVVVFTSYSLKNDTDFPIYVLATKRWPLSRIELENLNSSIPSELGLCLPPRSCGSWFLKSDRVHLKLLEDHTSEALLDLASLSGLTEISFEKEEGSGIKSVKKLGVSIGPSSREIVVPSQMVTLVPRYVICNESEECITVRQCCFQDEVAGVISINSKQRIPLQLREGFKNTREFSVFEHFIRKHRSSSDNSLLYIQVQTNEPGLGWSGPVCLASLGHFFLKFRKQTSEVTISDNKMAQYAAVHVAEEGSTLVLRFYKPPNTSLPYRVENRLHNLSITYYQKGSLEPEVLGPACSADYVWDDLTLPRRLVVRINDSLQLREIKLDKVRAWKPFYKLGLGQQSLLTPRLLLGKRSRDQMSSLREHNDLEMVKVGYEIYAEGPTRVLRICEIFDSFKRDTVFDLCAKIQLRVSQFAVHLLEHLKQEEDDIERKDFTPIVIAKLGNLHMITVSNNHQTYNQFSLQHMNLELKWNGAPFASMIRRHQLDYSDLNDSVLKVVLVLLTSSSNVKQFRYSSVFLQPIDLNLDEETLMKIASFWRTSLNDSESQQFYFDHFEIHPIKIIANFIPGESHSSYSSTQEALRSLIHSVVKVPPIKNMVVELNGVLITHALITMRELLVKCAQHYSWYTMRAIYIAKGSPLLPPDFVSIFDDLASSSLDVFFDPSRGLATLPGFTLGTFKFISKCIKGKGFSGTKRYFGDLGKTLRSAGSNIAFAAVAEISDSVLKGAEANGFNGLVSGFHQGMLKLAMEPSVLGTALMEGGPDRKILLDRSPGVDELYIEGYIQAMLDTVYRQEYLRVRVIDNQVILKNLPPNHSLINEITDRVKEFLVSKALLKGDPSTTSRPLSRLRGESEWRIGPTILTLCEHLFVSFAIRILRKQANKIVFSIKREKKSEVGGNADIEANKRQKGKVSFIRKWGIGKFVLSGLLAYIDGRLCRGIPNPVARRVVSGFLLSYIDQNDGE